MARLNSRARELEITRKKIIQAYKKLHGCKSCGYNENGYALQLNHIDPETKCKTMKSRSAIRYGWTWDRILDEIDKCEVLCANCHAIHTHTKTD